jgi:predicted DNA-binding transcriptional regulator AlpA
MHETLSRIIESKFKDKNWLTAQDLSEVFECDQKAIQAWIKSTLKLPEPKRPPCFRLGREVRFPKVELLVWIGTAQKE